MAERQYTEKEVLAILRKAAEYQTPSPASVDGVTASQIRAMAVDLGLSPEAVDMALRTQDDALEPSWADRLIGAPIVYEVDRTVPGEATADEWAEYVHSLRRSFGVSGTIGTVGNAFEWTTGDRELITTLVTVSAKGGKSRFRAASDASGAVFVTSLVVGMATFFGLLGALSWRTDWSWRLLVAAIVAGVGAALWRHVVNGLCVRRKEAVDRVTEEFVAQIGRGAAPVETAAVVPEIEETLELGAGD